MSCVCTLAHRMHFIWKTQDSGRIKLRKYHKNNVCALYFLTCFQNVRMMFVSVYIILNDWMGTAAAAAAAATETAVSKTKMYISTNTHTTQMQLQSNAIKSARFLQQIIWQNKFKSSHSQYKHASWYSSLFSGVASDNFPWSHYIRKRNKDWLWQLFSIDC